MKQSVGCIITRKNRVLSIGYNGTPIDCLNCYEGGCDRCNKGIGKGAKLDTCFCLHSETSAIFEIGAKQTENATLYCTLLPCTFCTKAIIQCVR